MSLISQSPPRGPFWVRFAAGAAVTAVVVSVAVGPYGGAILAALGRARPHAPDLDLFSRLPLAIQIHLLAALTALVLGAVLMAVRKGQVFHRTAGWMWVGLVSLTAGSSIFITSLNRGQWSLLHLFTAWTLIILPVGVFWAKRREVRRHRRAMMGLFYGGFALNLFIAFIPGRTLWSMVFG